MKKNTLQSFGKVGQILDVGLNSTSTGSVLAFVRDSVSRGYKFWLTTPNPEIIFACQKDKKLQKALEVSDMAIPDGIGLAQAAKFMSLPAPKNRVLRFFVLLIQGAAVGLATFFNKDWLFSSLRFIKGRVLFLELVKLASKKKWKIFLLGGGPGVAKTAGLNLRKSFKGVRIAYFAGPLLDRKGEPQSAQEVEIQKEAIAQINEFQPHLLFVAFGAPKQEKWVFKRFGPRQKRGGGGGGGGGGGARGAGW